MRTLSRPDGPIAFLLGKPVRDEFVFPEVFERLRRHGREVRVHLPHETGDFVPGWLADAALLVHRGLNPAVAGRACRGLLKPWPRRESATQRLFAPEPMLGELALAVGRVLALEIYGVDFVVGEIGPLIVDVNGFPGFKGVPEAARLIGDYLL